MNFKKTLIASSISAASMALTPLAANALTISASTVTTTVSLDATGLLITNNGSIDLSFNSFPSTGVTVPGFGLLTADIDIDAGSSIIAGAPTAENNPIGIQFFDSAILTGTITNNGTITAETGGAGIVFSDGSSLIGDIINGASGIIRGNTFNFIDASAIQISQNFSPSIPGTGVSGGFDDRPVLVGSITNNGIIEGLGGGNGIDLQSGEITGTITNNPGATIRSTEETAILIESGNVGGGIINSGTIISSSIDFAGIEVINPFLHPATFNGGITNNVGGVITAPAGGILIDEGATFNGGINNAGIITGTAQGVAAIDVFSDLVNGALFVTTFNGDITNASTGIIQNIATGLTAVSETAAAIAFGAVSINGSITNSGTISSAERTAISMNAFQEGSLANYTIPETVLTGSIVNNSGGIISGVNGIQNNGSIISNDITNNAGGIISGLISGIGLTNTKIEVDDSGSTVATVQAGLTNIGGSITNSGTIENTATATDITSLMGQGVGAERIAAIALNSSSIVGGDIVNTATGVISTVSANAISIGDNNPANGPTLTGDINNSGDIISPDMTAIFLNNGTIGGSIINAAGATIDGSNGGVVAFNSTVTGGLSNSGAIAAAGPNGPATDNAYAIDIQNSTIGAVNNAATGVITGGFILEQSTMSGDFTNAGSLQSATAGGDAYVLRGGNSAQGDLINSGTISADLNGGVIVEQAATLANIVNSGAITGGEVAIGVIDGGSQIGTITNDIGGVLTGGSFGAITALNGGVIGSVSNAGTVNGVTDFGAGGGSFSNSGTAAAVLGANTVTNSGTLGDVVLVAAGGSFSSSGGSVGNVSNVLGDVTNGGVLGNLTFVGAGGDLTNTGSTGDVAGVTGVTTSGDMGNVQFVPAGGAFVSTAGTVGTVTDVTSVDNGGTLAGINFVAGGGPLINSGTVSSDITEATVVTNSGALNDVTLVAGGGTFSNTGGGTAGNVSNALGNVLNDGSVGDLNLVDTAGNSYFGTGDAGDIVNVDLVSNLGGSVGNVTFQALANGLYTSVGNTTVGSIDGASAIQVLMDLQAPGITTATINSNLTFNGILTLQAASMGTGINDYSRLQVNGTADVTGATVFILANGIDMFAQGDGFTFLTSTGTLSSDITAFAACDFEIDSACETPIMSIMDNSTVLDFNVVQNGNSLSAVIGDVNFAPTLPPNTGNTGSGNTAKVANVLIGLVTPGSPIAQGPGFGATPLGTAINRLVTLSTNNTAEGQAAYARALASLDAETVEGGSLSALQADTVAAATIDNRTAALRGYYGFSGTMAGDPLAINGFWLQGYGNETDQGIRDGVDGFDADTFGIGMGLDAPIGERVTLGVAFSYADTDVNMKQESRNQMLIDSYRLSAYGSYNADTYYLDGQLAYAMNDYETERAISPLLSPAQLIAKGQHDGNQYNLRLRGGYPIATDSGWYVTPTAEVNYTFLSEDRYSEKGAGNLGLTLAADDVEVLVLSVGVKLAYPITTKNEVTWIPEFNLNYAYDTIGDEVEVDSNFVAVTGAAFITNGANVEQQAVKASFKVRAFSDGNFSFAAGYDYVDKQDYNSQSLTATVRYDF